MCMYVTYIPDVYVHVLDYCWRWMWGSFSQFSRKQTLAARELSSLENHLGLLQQFLQKRTATLEITRAPEVYHAMYAGAALCSTQRDPTVVHQLERNAASQRKADVLLLFLTLNRCRTQTIRGMPLQLWGCCLRDFRMYVFSSGATMAAFCPRFCVS